MFDSGISVKNLVEELKNEVDVALDIPNATYVTWLNSLQQLLYTEIIKEQGGMFFDGAMLEAYKNPLDLGNLGFEDVVAIYVDGVQLKKSSLASGCIFPNTFYKLDENKVVFNIDKEPTEEFVIIYICKPLLIKVDSNDEIGEGNVMLQIEFIDLAKSKLRGEAYKLANEFDIAANWLNDYNVLLESFKAWIADKAPAFGI